MARSKEVKKQDRVARVVVIGTSAGGLNALTKLISQLQENFPAPILVVQHISADATGDVLLEALQSSGKLICQHAVNETKLEPGHLYLAPSDHHLMIDGNRKLLVTKGAQENRFRPAIDPLFRSAAVAFSNHVIGILLTGYLDDGAAGMKVIKKVCRHLYRPGPGRCRISGYAQKRVEPDRAGLLFAFNGNGRHTLSADSAKTGKAETNTERYFDRGKNCRTRFK